MNSPCDKEYISLRPETLELYSSRPDYFKSLPPSEDINDPVQ